MGLPTTPVTVSFRDLARDLDPERLAMLFNELGRQQRKFPPVEMDGIDDDGLKFLDTLMDAITAHERDG